MCKQSTKLWCPIVLLILGPTNFIERILGNYLLDEFDDSLQKKGKYHPDRNILVDPINSLSINKVTRLIVTVSEKWHDKLKSQLQSINSKAKLWLKKYVLA